MALSLSIFIYAVLRKTPYIQKANLSGEEIENLKKSFVLYLGYYLTHMIQKNIIRHIITYIFDKKNSTTWKYIYYTNYGPKNVLT